MKVEKKLEEEAEKEMRRQNRAEKSKKRKMQPKTDVQELEEDVDDPPPLKVKRTNTKKKDELDPSLPKVKRRKKKQ